jgi:hypothetical protein
MDLVTHPITVSIGDRHGPGLRFLALSLEKSHGYESACMRHL